MLTIDEQERRAYISGDTREAALLARIEDLEADGTENEMALQDDLDQAGRDLEDTEDACEALREQVQAIGEAPCA